MAAGMPLKPHILILFPILYFFGCTSHEPDAVYPSGREYYGDYSLDTTNIVYDLERGGDVLVSGETDSAIAIFNALYTRSNVLDYRYGKARSLEGLARAYFRKGEMSESTRYLELGIELLKDTPRFYGYIGRLYVQIANNFQTQGYYSMSIIYCYKALEYLEHQPGELKRLAEAYSVMGGLWVRLEEKSQAVHFLMKADSLAKMIGYNSLLALNSLHLGSYYKEDTVNDSSLTYYRMAIHYLEQEEQADILVKIAALTNISFIYYQKRMPENAEAIMQEVVHISAENSTPLVRAIVDVALGYSMFARNSPDSAVYFYERALEYALPHRQTDFLIPVYQGLVSIYEKQRDYRKANEYQKHLDTLRQFNEKFERSKTVDLLLKYHLARKNEEISRQQLSLSVKEAQLKEAYAWLMFAIIILVILLLLGIHFYRIYQHKQKLQQSVIQNIHDKQAIGNLQALMEGEEQERNRIGRVLHDSIMIQLSAVKMQLSSMRGSMEEKQYNGLLNNVNNIIREIRFTAHNLMPDWLLEDGLNDALRYFSNSIESNYGIRTIYRQYGNIPRFESDFELSIYRIVQELVQNIIKHARSPKALIELSYIDGYLHIVVEDNGMGFDISRIKEHRGSRMGLVSIRRRVKALHGKIELQSHLNVGTTTYLEFDTRDRVQTEKEDEHQTG